MKVKIFILFSLLFLTGCTATYNVEIKDNTIKEHLNLVETNKAIFDIPNESGWTLRGLFDSYLSKDVYSKADYTIKSLNNNDRLGIDYKNNNLSEIKNLSLLNQCYNDYYVSNTSDIVQISTGENFTCNDYYNNLESFKVVIKTNHKVLSSNATRVEGNKYIWEIGSSDSKNIEFSYSKDEIIKSFPYLIVTLCVLGICILICIYFLIRRKIISNNKI